ncbi:MAG: hypothetical protein JWN84_1031 [Nocardioides sp.]|jgi:hypothetical protein|nr:hypothetical protein [Nocardioides sp.]
MPTETQRQEARRRAREVRSEHAMRRKEKEKRLEDLAVAVLVALDRRTECERQAGRALTAMVEGEGLSLHDAIRWCGSAVSLRTATRLKSLAAGCGPDNAVDATAEDTSERDLVAASEAVAGGEGR